MAIPTTKVCTKCGIEKNLDEFAVERRRASGYAAWCVACTKAYNAARAVRTPVEIPKEKVCTTCNVQKPIAEFGTDRYTIDGKATRCILCKRAESAEYRGENPDKVRAANAAWRAAHPEEVAAYAEANKDKIGKRRRERYGLNPEKENLVNNAWYEANKATRKLTMATWDAAHPEYPRMKMHRRRSRQRALPNTWTTEQREFMLTYWKHSCAACGNPEGFFWFLADDHFVPLASPDCPGTTAGNMLPLCHGTNGCNNSKSDTNTHTWLVRRFGAKKAAKIEKAIAAYFAIVATTFPDQGAS